MHPKDADGMANSVDPDQTASSEAVWSWSALFAETYLSQYIEFVRYTASSKTGLRDAFSTQWNYCNSYCIVYLIAVLVYLRYRQLQMTFTITLYHIHFILLF